MKNRTLPRTFVFLFLVFSILVSQREHTVKTGDTLWDIAGFYYGNPFFWVGIWKANIDMINDPHWIYPGQVFVIPEIPPEEVAKIPKGVYPLPKPVPAEKFEIIVLKPPIPAVAEELILSGGFIEFKENIKPIGEIIGTEPEGLKNLHFFEKIYLNKGELDGFKKDDIYLIFEYGKPVKSRRTGENLGVFVKILGKLKILKTEERSSLAEIYTAYDIINVGAKILPLVLPEVPYDTKLFPSEREIEGEIVKRTKPEKRIFAPHEIVFIDVGEKDNVKIGDLFEIYREGKQVKDPETGNTITLPDLFLGTLQVLNVRTKASTAYVRAVAREDINVGDKVRLVGEVRPQKKETN